MLKVALFCDTPITRSGITSYCYSLKKLLESSCEFYVRVFTDLPCRKVMSVSLYDVNAIKNAILSDDFDIIHINGFISTIPYYVMKIMKILGINKPVVFTPHAHPFCTLNHPFLSRLFFHLFVKSILKKADKLISINKEDFDFFSKYNKNVVTIPHWNWVKMKFVRKAQKKNKPLILFVGRNDANKNLSLLYSLPMNKYEIVCVTNVKPKRDDFVFKTSISREELETLYERASLTVIPSRYEAFSYTAMESLLSGTPVLLSNRVRIADFLEHVSGVTIYDYEKPTDFVNKIDEAINQSVDIDSVQNIFSANNALNLYSNIYKDLYSKYNVC